MTKKCLILIMLAVLTALTLIGCGRTDTSTLDSSSPEGIQTFGVEVDPSAEPSMGQVMPEILDAAEETVPEGPTSITGQDTQANENDTPTEEPEEVTAEPSTKPTASTPTSTPTATPSEAPSASPSPTIAPPAPMSSATSTDAEAYVGRQLSELIDALGYPSSSDYVPVDENDLSLGEIGTLYFSGYTVSTKRFDGVETVTSVIATSSGTEEATSEDAPSE